jgi:hypothetical protein
VPQGQLAAAPAQPLSAAVTGGGKELLKTLRVPIAYFVGKTDMARPNALDDFERIESVPVFVGVLEIPGDAHGGTYRPKNDGQLGVAGVAWLAWRLKGNQEAAKLFKGADCGLCRDPEWEVQKKID